MKQYRFALLWLLPWPSAVAQNRQPSEKDSVNTTAEFRGALVAGGKFKSIGGKPADNIASFDGAHWVPLGDGLNGEVHALLPRVSSDLIVGGLFTGSAKLPLQHVARWDGAHWQGLGAGLMGSINALAEFSGVLYAGGESLIDGSPLAVWDGTQWKPVWKKCSGSVHALQTLGSSLLAAGDFNCTQDPGLATIARLQGQEWKGLGGGINGTILALADYKGDLAVGGQFNIGKKHIRNLARFASGDWKPLARAEPGPVTAISEESGRLLVAGYLEKVLEQKFSVPEGALATTQSGGLNHQNAAWRVMSFHADALTLFGNVDDRVRSLGVFKNHALVTGEFLHTDIMRFNGYDFFWQEQKPYSLIAQMRGDYWWPLSECATESIHGKANAMAARAGKLFLAGDFSAAYCLPAENVAEWDGATWRVMGDGVPSRVDELHLLPMGNLAAISFTVPEGLVEGRIAWLWNGTKWEKYPAIVEEQLAHATHVEFDTQGRILASIRIKGQADELLLRYDHDGWKQLGHFTAWIRSIACVMGKIYVAGGFPEVDGVKAYGFALWDGDKWEGLGNENGCRRMSVLPGDYENRTEICGDIRLLREANGSLIIASEGRKSSLTTWSPGGRFPITPPVEGDIYSAVPGPDGYWLVDSGLTLQLWDGKNWVKLPPLKALGYFQEKLLATNPQVSIHDPDWTQLYEWKGERWQILSGVGQSQKLPQR